MMTKQAERDIEEGFKLDQAAWELLDYIVSEWKSDPMSVQCFDLRKVEEAKQLISRRKTLDKRTVFPVLTDQEAGSDS